MTTPYIPKGYHTITPYLLVEGAAEMIEFLQTVFDATPILISRHGDEIGHAALQIGDSMLEVWARRGSFGATRPREIPSGGSTTLQFAPRHPADESRVRAVRVASAAHKDG